MRSWPPGLQGLDPGHERGSVLSNLVAPGAGPTNKGGGGEQGLTLAVDRGHVSVGVLEGRLSQSVVTVADGRSLGCVVRRTCV